MTRKKSEVGQSGLAIDVRELSHFDSSEVDTFPGIRFMVKSSRSNRHVDNRVRVGNRVPVDNRIR